MYTHLNSFKSFVIKLLVKAIIFVDVDDAADLGSEVLRVMTRSEWTIGFNVVQILTERHLGGERGL